MQGTLLEPRSGRELERACADLGRSLGLEVQTQVRVGRRVWGPRRQIDAIFIDRQTRRSLGVECKYQGVGGTAEEKIPATIEDIRAWPIEGIVCFSGPGFSDHMRLPAVERQGRRARRPGDVAAAVLRALTSWLALALRGPGPPLLHFHPLPTGPP